MSSNEQKILEIDSLIPEVRSGEKKEKREVWESCCLQTDSHAVAYFGQLSISILILAFSFIMLIKANGSCEQSSPYIGLISFLMGKLLSSVVGSGS